MDPADRGGPGDEHYRLGTMLTPVPRRRVQKLAREVTTLDRLTRGRMIIGAGLGSPIADEFGSFGEPTDPKELAGRLPNKAPRYLTSPVHQRNVGGSRCPGCEQ